MGIERQHDCANRALQDIAKASRTNRVSNGGAISYGTCQAFTRELQRVAWPTKFYPELPSRYDGSTNHTEFLQLYVMAIQVASGDDRVMAN